MSTDTNDYTYGDRRPLGGLLALTATFMPRSSFMSRTIGVWIGTSFNTHDPW